MEIKITADRKLLDALERIAAAIAPVAAPVAAPEAPRRAKAAQTKTDPTPAPEPATAPTEAATTAPDVPWATTQETPPAETAAPAAVPTREEVQKLAIARVHEGKREEMRALLARYQAARVSEVAEGKLAAFKAELEVL